MKNLLFITTIFCLGFNHVSANNPLKMTSLDLSVDDKSIVLNLADFIADADFFKIIDNKGEIIFSDEIEKNKHRIRYDLAQLPNGIYLIKVEGAHLVEYHHISISDDIISLEDSQTYYRPSIRILDQKVLVNSASESEEFFTLNIYNEMGETIYSFNEKKSGKYHKAFDLKNLKKGTYKVIVSTDHFSHEIEISL